MGDVNKTREGTWGSLSWTNDFPGMPAFFASQRTTRDPIAGTYDWPLFQTFRFGMDRLKFEFPVPDGEYLVELYFTEPWYGTGGGMDASGWRIFDVAVNGKTLVDDLDIWKEVGHDHALKKTVKAKVKGGKLEISFSEVKAGQAIISAIAIATTRKGVKAAARSPLVINDFKVHNAGETDQWQVKTWLNTGDRQFVNDDAQFSALPSVLYTAEWIQTPANLQNSEGTILAEFVVRDDADVFIALNKGADLPAWMEGFKDTEELLKNHKGQQFKVYKKEFKKSQKVIMGGLKEVQLAALAAEVAGARSYTIAVVPVTSMGEQPDPRPVVLQQAVDAVFSGTGHTQALFRDKPYIKLTGAEGSSIEWEVSPGLASIYLLRFKYMNDHDKAIPMRIQIIASDGRLMRDDVIDFPPTPGKWKLLSTTTGQFINAGHYKVRLTTAGLEGLSIDSFEFQ